MKGDDQATIPTGRPDVPVTPEEVARAFIRDGGTLDFGDEDEGRWIRRKSFLSAVAAIVVVSGAVAAYVIWLNPKTPDGQASTALSASTTAGASGATPPTSVTPTTVQLPANNAVTVEVLNASNTSELASHTATGLEQVGFVVSVVSDAPSVIAGGSPSDIFYGPNGLPAAQVLALSLNGSVSLLPDASLSGNNVTLWIAGPKLTVKTASSTP
jgi:hypothetical protein